MSVVFKKTDGFPAGNHYDIVITISVNSMDPTTKLKNLQVELNQLLKDASIDGMETNYYWPLTLLQEMIPDKQTFESLNKI